MRTRSRATAVDVLRCAWAIRLVSYAQRHRHDMGEAHRRLRITAAYALAGRQAVAALGPGSQQQCSRPRWPAVLDGLHALSMIPVAILSRSLRRDALRSGLVSALLAVASQPWLRDP